MKQERLKELYRYQSDGSLTYAVRTSNRIRIGDPVGHRHSKGYIRTQCDGQRVYLHQMVWVWHNGPIPEGQQVDHINGNKADNRIENLQLLSNRENVAKGMKAWKPGDLPTGVCWKANRGKFYAAIHDQAIGKQRHLGSFDTADDAAAAYRLALEGI